MTGEGQGLPREHGGEKRGIPAASARMPSEGPSAVQMSQVEGRGVQGNIREELAPREGQEKLRRLFLGETGLSCVGPWKCD